MLRLQTALPDRYTTADPDQLARWIGAAKAELGSRVIILGHHYQRDEVMAWADSRGDSFGLAQFAAQQTLAELSTCHTDHFGELVLGRARIAIVKPALEAEHRGLVSVPLR